MEAIMNHNKCAWCSNEAKEGKSLCEKHLAINRATSKKRYNENCRKGLCNRCGKETKNGKTICDSCYPITVETSKRWLLKKILNETKILREGIINKNA